MRHGGFRDLVNFSFGSFEFASLMAGSIAPEKAISILKIYTFQLIVRGFYAARSIDLFSMT